MDELQMAAAFNEWMRRYIEEPEQFEREFQSVTEFNAAVDSGNPPSYGTDCAAYMLKVHGELTN